MGMSWTDSKELARLRCESCGRPLDLRCEDCGCLVSCHDFVYPEQSERVLYCLWDFEQCPTEQRPVFLAAMDAWLRDQQLRPPRRSQTP